MIELLYFKSKFCGQCRKYLPIIEQLEKDYPNIGFSKIDIDDKKELVEKYQIGTLPTTILIEGDKILKRIQGVIPKSKMIQAIEEVMQ